jgi:hypothetical protein
MADEIRHIQVLMGPYRDHRLSVSAADAEAAINAHWAVDPFPPPDDHPHDPLTEEQRTAALEAATAWAQLQWDTAQGVKPPDPPPDPPAGRAKKAEEKRDMKPEEHSGGYTTRDKR